uniref:complement C1r subcomponent-like protein isoform X3 n=1 Tax=Nyctereutes procyonoides TaxID=34880 RepID=UPI002443E082|nr:complement C1r subcomponent-like protein isoform X3 [Nyctereutes procyonoides]
MSSSRCLVSQLGNDLWRSPQSTGCPGKMWWLLLWGVFQACPTQGSVLLAQQLPQQLTSPGYPEPYRKGQESSTDIEAPDGFAVRLVFQDFDLEPSQDCEQDSVTITASGMDPSRFCGQQGSSLGSPPGQREFVSPGNRLRLTFRAPASSRDRTTGLHRGFLALYQAVDVNHSRRPISQASGASKAISTRGDPDPLKIQNHCCREPYYQAVPAGESPPCFSLSSRFIPQGHSPAHPRIPGRRHRIGRSFLTVSLSAAGPWPPSPRARRPSVPPEPSWATSPGKLSPASTAEGAGPCWETGGSSLPPTPSNPRTASSSGRTAACMCSWATRASTRCCGWGATRCAEWWCTRTTASTRPATSTGTSRSWSSSAACRSGPACSPSACPSARPCTAAACGATSAASAWTWAG